MILQKKISEKQHSHLDANADAELRYRYISIIQIGSIHLVS